MPRPMNKAARSVPWLAAAALVCAMAAPGPDAARAQTADNLKCNKCVDSGDLARKAITKNRIKSNAVSFGKLHPKVQDAMKQDRTFYVTVDSDGAEATLVTQGPLRVFVRCFVGAGAGASMQFVYTSTADGWFVLGDPTVRSAGEERVPVTISFVGGGPASADVLLQGAIAPDGSVISLRQTTGVGSNIFGHACLVQGSASGITGAP